MAAIRIRAWLALALALVLAAPAAAIDLDTARAQGLVGERTDGYVGVVTSDASPEVRALVDEVNAKRRAAYEEIARKNGTDVESVAGLAAQKVIDRLPPGSWISDGTRWYIKK